jgi:hypothetical protein
VRYNIKNSHMGNKPPITRNQICHLQTTTAASTLPPGAIARDRGDVLDPTDLNPIPRQCPQRALRPGSGTATLVPPRASNLDVEGGNAQFLATRGDVLRGQHGGVRRALVAIGLDLHASRDSDERLAAREVGHVHEGIVEGCEEVGHGEYLLALDEVG